MANQTTIAKETAVSGIGLHTGKKSKVVFKPAPANTGVKFIRVDLPKKTEIKADWTNAQGVHAVRGSIIAKDGAEISTIEHIMASLYSFAIDNVIIEINSAEPPILDGSAVEFANALIKAGIQELDIAREYFIIDKSFDFEIEKTKYSVLPSDGLAIDCAIGFEHPFLKYQRLIIDRLDKDIFIKEIAPAKTFCFDFEIEYLQKHNLSLGGSFDNAIVIGAQGILNKQPLRYQDEFVRHKILDLIGDLYLAGKPIKAKIIADKPGHQNNINLVKELIKKAKIGG
ncbi:MAG: UDP-3-O-acyl-N-acetylglucosamine deacetylase [Elusimicrobiota bacterium]|jgi:UDP-3-O-acyl N-acetylglucosamine deacetylase|nr:UDP-3-O-acyl-N-acetylglucosamine deacetylase [Elusimicrobiota bacterium]